MRSILRITSTSRNSSFPSRGAGLKILVQITVEACWLVTSHSPRRSSHPPPDARAHALHVLHLQGTDNTAGAPDQRESVQQNSSVIHRAGAECRRRRRTDPTPAASTPAAAAVAPAPTKREAMANALNGIATAVPPLPRRNHATPAAACAALAAAHHGHLSAATPPPPRSSIAAATRVFWGGQHAATGVAPFTSAESHRQVGPPWIGSSHLQAH